MIKPPPWPPGLTRTILDQTDSTNLEAQRLAQAGAPPGWIVATNQTAGRGSRGRHWSSDPGNFAGSLLFRPEISPASATLRSFTAALALAQVFEVLGIRSADITLKWPNDVLIGGRKSAGILLESSGFGDRITYLIVGIGVNLTSAPPPQSLPTGALPATSLDEHLADVPSPAQFLDFLAPKFDRLEQSLNTFGFAPIRENWLSRAGNLNRMITVRAGQEMISGNIETLDDSGALVLATDQGRRVISTGEIFFPEQNRAPNGQQASAS